MTEANQDTPGLPSSSRPRTGLYLTLSAALFVLLLAVGAVLWPAGRGKALLGLVLVFDSTGDQTRIESLYQPLAAFLAETGGQGMDLVVARSRGEFLTRARRGADFLFCPDGLALQLDPDVYEPLVCGRRAAPRNLRPRSVLVYRRAAGLLERPWLERPLRTVVGDSLSLAAAGAVLADGGPGGLGCSWGPDPYDHSPVLHALRLGGFDYACVRQWDAERFFGQGLLADAEWGIKNLTDPVPDGVLMASRKIPRPVMVKIGESLTGMSRSGVAPSPAGEILGRGLPGLQLVGFNFLLEPDFQRVRGIFKGYWQAGSD